MAERPGGRATRWIALAGFTLLGAAALTSCDSRPTPADGAAPRDGAAASALRAGTWRAVLAVPGGELPFGLEFEREGERWVATLVNGADRTRVDEVTLQGKELQLRMPGFENTLTATVDGDTLRGEVLMIKLAGKHQHIPFTAYYGQRFRFAAPAPAATGLDSSDAPPAPDFSGRWALQFDEGSSTSPAVGEFTQQGTTVAGTVLTPTGDHRFLAGDVVDGELRLSKFDGGHVFLYRARLRGDGTLEGRYWSGLAFTQAFSGRRDAAANLGDAAGVTQLRDASAPLDIRFPDLDRNMVSLRDARFAGKVLIIVLAGSWCPNCHDEAAFLAPFYRQNRERGLEVVSLMFEQFGDFPQAAAATRRFRARSGIEYPTLIAGTSDKDDAARRLPQLNGVFAFPTTIFVDRTGRVRRIHTGFSGPATGEHHRALIEEFETLVDELLAETPDPKATRAAGA